MAFLDILQASKWKKVTISSEDWLSKLWQSSKRALIEQNYASNNYKIQYDGKKYLYIDRL